MSTLDKSWAFSTTTTFICGQIVFARTAPKTPAAPPPTTTNTGSSRGFTLLPCFSTALKQKPQQNTTSFSRTNWAVYASRERETHPCKYWCSKTNTYRERLPVNHKIRIKREFIWKLLNCNSLHKAIKILEWYCKQFTQREMTKCQNTTSLITKCVVYASRKRKNISL